MPTGLNQLPLGIVGIAVATTLLPLLARHIEGGREDHARHYISRAIEFCLMLGLPATIGLTMLAQPIIQTLFEHGAFTHDDTMATAETLAAYALGIPAFLLVKVLHRIFRAPRYRDAGQGRAGGDGGQCRRSGFAARPHASYRHRFGQQHRRVGQRIPCCSGGSTANCAWSATKNCASACRAF